MAKVPAAEAGEALRWADDLRRAGTVEEYGLAPANLEDVYVELVGRADALREPANGDGAGPVGATSAKEGTDVRAA